MKLEVGKKYRTRGAKIVVIERLNPTSTHPYVGDNYLTYTEEGHWLGKTLSIHDLIEEIKETKMKLEVGKYYKSRVGEVVKIIEYHADNVYKYSDNEGETYQENGQYCRSLPGDDLDLIEEVIPVPAYRVKAEQTDKRDFTGSMESEKGKVYTKFRVPSYFHKKFINMGGWSYYATQVDAGYIDPITGEFVMNVNESKKLKLEVGKTYRDGNGELNKIIKHVTKGFFPEHVYWSDKRTYTVEGFFSSDKGESKYNLIEEVEVEVGVEVKVETKTTKKEQPKMKYYRTTVKNTEADDDFLVGTIVTLFKDDTTGMPSYKDVNSDRKQYLYTDRLEEINVKTVKTVISPASKLVKILEDSGYEVVSGGNWWKRDTGMYFVSSMFLFCGKEPDEEYTWLPEWLEEKVVFDSTVNTFNARQFIVDFMKKKRELSHEAYLYQRDIDEIENEWSDEECERVAGRILSRKDLGFCGSSCPFCTEFTGDCDDCSYGKRHGICSDHTSDFHKHIRPITYSRAWPELLDFVDNYPGARK